MNLSLYHNETEVLSQDTLHHVTCHKVKYLPRFEWISVNFVEICECLLMVIYNPLIGSSIVTKVYL